MGNEIIRYVLREARVIGLGPFRFTLIVRTALGLELRSRVESLPAIVLVYEEHNNL